MLSILNYPVHLLVLTIIKQINVMRQFTTQTKLFILTLLSLWFSSNQMSAQLTLEATYPTTDVRRIHLPVSGEKWYYADDSTRKVYLFNANHTAWKTVNYPSEANKKVSLDVMNKPVSETTFNTDDFLEFVWRFEDSTTRRERVRILNERNDSVYAFSEGVNVLTVNELAGSPTKLFVENGYNDKNRKTSIFTLPNMILDTAYNNASEMRRQRFGYAGEKYYFRKLNPNKVEICNANYQHWKSIPIDVPTNALTYKDPTFFADDKVFNADSSVEFMFKYNHGLGEGLTKIISEGNIYGNIKYANSNSSLRLDQMLGQSNKLILREWYSNNNKLRYKVFNLPNVDFEATYKCQDNIQCSFERILLKQYGVQYVNIGYRHIKLSNVNHLNWKTITLVPTVGYDFLYTYGYDIATPLVCDSIVHPDSLLEVIWNEWRRITPKTLACQLRITSENGNNIVTVPNASFVEVNQLDKLSSKLITKTWDSTRYTETKVWRFTARTPVADPSVSAAFDVQISPNPFSNYLTINILDNTIPLSIKLFNAVGMLVFSEKMTTSNATFMLPNGLPQGVYWCQLSDGKSQIVKTLVKVN